jgi:hypothetical protein
MALTSKSWRNLPHSVTSINLDQNDYEDYALFYNVLNRMLHEKNNIESYIMVAVNSLVFLRLRVEDLQYYYTL